MPYTGPRNKILYGKDFNFYQKTSVNNGTYNTDCDVIIPFSTQSVMLLNESTSGSNVIEYSFNGNTTHGELDPTLPTRGMTFDNRVVSKIWFKVKGGSVGPVSVRVDAWATR